VISPREIVLAFLVPALLCVLCGALAARMQAGLYRRLVQALAVALPFCLSFYALSGYVPVVDPLSSATQLVPLLALPVAVASSFGLPGTPILAALGLFGLLFARLGSPPGWPERVDAALALGLAWSAGRSSPEQRPAWRPLLALAIFAGAVACACICGRSAALALICGGLGASIGANFLASLRWPSWSFGVHGFDVAVFALGGALACAVYLSELNPYAGLALLASLAVMRLASFPLAFGIQFALTALALWIAWPADGFAF
jgi:hypothetical protein